MNSSDAWQAATIEQHRTFPAVGDGSRGDALVGNVEEWTATEFAPYPGAPDVVSGREDQAGVDPHVTRGGDWIHAVDLARCVRRHRAFDPRLVGVGLRIVADV